jgi:acetolactate synthase regulatory subunit
MITDLHPRPATASPSLRSGGDRLQLILEVTESGDVLVRVLGVLQRRRCRVTHVEYVAPDRHRPGRLAIGVEAPANRAHCVESWLANLVDVLSVEPA